MAYVTTIGMDYANGKYIAYVQVLNFANIAKAESMDIGKSVPAWIGKGEGKTASEALTSIYPTSQLQLFWGHVKAIILSENLLKQGISETFDALNRYREIRYNILLYGTREPFTELLSQKSILNFSPIDSLLTKPEKSYAQKSLIPPQYSFKYKAHENEPGNSAMLPSLALNRQAWKEDREEKSEFQIDGAYFLNKGKYSHWLSDKDLLGARWIHGKLVISSINVPNDDHPVAVLKMKDPKLRIYPVIKGNGFHFDIQLKLKAEFAEVIEKLPEQEIQKAAEQAVQNEIRMTYQKGIESKCDVYQLSEALYRNHPKAWKQHFQDGDFQLRMDSLQEINVEVHIQHTGKYKK